MALVRFKNASTQYEDLMNNEEMQEQDEYVYSDPNNPKQEYGEDRELKPPDEWNQYNEDDVQPMNNDNTHLNQPEQQGEDLISPKDEQQGLILADSSLNLSP